MSDGFLGKTVPVVVGGAILLKGTQMLFDYAKEKKGRKKKSVKKLKKVI